MAVSPRVRLLHDFLSEAEAARLLLLAEPLFESSPVRSVATDRRTSSTATLGGAHARDWAVMAVRANPNPNPNPNRSPCPSPNPNPNPSQA